ncbi:hypothetical protein [Streptomyces sp. NRRL S-813]|uniref:hypothetical protein n=1 Tax=Streptomyces sp. NRRL S-813 TaxID=1463919 RepID=UPI000D1ABE47
MHEAGLLRREQASQDRRAMQVWLTDKGKTMRRPHRPGRSPRAGHGRRWQRCLTRSPP